MTHQDLAKLVSAIDDGEAAILTLTDADNNHHTLNGVYKESQAPCFFFLAPPGALPADIDRSWRGFFISNDHEGKEVSFLVDIVEQTNTRSVELICRQTVRFEEMRRYFRVTLRTPVIIRFFTENPERSDEDWQLEGETIDISQSGVLAVLPEECRTTENLDIELILDQPAKRVFCKGHVVRAKRFKKQRWLTSFHFDEIASGDRDALAKRCFAEQRRQLREKGQTY